ncbi:LuxR family two component transcriptional regulator [Stackebrandtia albiflava]|uniref:LuxR family two component transcriptional regulator n=1 Tax=Stackebrandtia albiflava TaxID=406432 RepID=A0A562V2R3_9ACTN|nr:response regulator transcription factor [Stackebrandtia albiflava]TWJ12133.1 LuxR family two component transcriptional regulator [Stackebrandtia albiflava]
MTGDPITVLIADDDPLARAGLGMILGGHPGVTVVAEAADGEAAVTTARRCRPDVVLMDIRMPRMDGLAATETLRADPSPPEILVLTTFDADAHVLRALRAGAAGFLLKDTPPVELVEAVRRVADGRPVLSPTVMTRLIARVTDTESETARRRRAAAARLERLNDREREVAIQLGHGRSNAEIAAALHLSVPTIKTHVSAVLAALGLNNRVQVALLVHDAGLSDHDW